MYTYSLLNVILEAKYIDKPSTKTCNIQCEQKVADNYWSLVDIFSPLCWCNNQCRDCTDTSGLTTHSDWLPFTQLETHLCTVIVRFLCFLTLTCSDLRPYKHSFSVENKYCMYTNSITTPHSHPTRSQTWLHEITFTSNIYQNKPVL